MNNRAKNLHTGFTLLEMISALGVFSVVIMIFSATFLNLLNAERKTQGASTIQDNLRFALETMAKDIRTGTGYSVNDLNTPTVFHFTNVSGQAITYRLSDPAQDTVCAAGRCIGKIIGSGSLLPLTSDDISINSLRFYLYTGANIQPRVLIAISAQILKAKTPTTLNVQTLVSQRKAIRVQGP